ncbi:MAG: hypothetical protein HRF43_14090 [Phycisphaerae bacterium]|jgi:predicted RNA-binding Zn-ribbon protein involved in translation (DUF1610 family)
MSLKPIPAFAARRSLLRSIDDGSASAAVRLAVSLAAGLMLTSACCALSFALSAVFPPPWVRGSYNPGSSRIVFVSDEVALLCFAGGGIVYLIMLGWVWSRHRRAGSIVVGAGQTAVLWVAAGLVCYAISENFGGDEEMLMSAALCAAGAATLVLWLRLYHRHAAGRELFDDAGAVDLRCPECQYQMVGLKDARCPECGREYTLDELVRKQDFRALRERPSPADVSAADSRDGMHAGTGSDQLRDQAQEGSDQADDRRRPARRG